MIKTGEGWTMKTVIWILLIVAVIGVAWWFMRSGKESSPGEALDQAIENIGEAAETAREKLGDALEGSGKTDESNGEDQRQ